MMAWLRSILSLVAGFVIWMAAFWIVMILMALVWPALREAARVYMGEDGGSYAVFTTPMLISFQFVWPVANAAGGFLTRVISNRQREVRWLAVLLTAYFAYNHWWALWNELPVWYNVIVVLPVAPMVLIGGLIGGRVRKKRPA